MKAWLATVVLVAASSAMAEDMQQYLNETQQMVRHGKYEQALERFQWFHEHAIEHDPGMSEIRLSFALSYWKSLGDAYPPARAALVETRDRTANRFADAPSFSVAQELVALNRTLDEGAKNLELFHSLDRNNAVAAQQCWILFKDAVIAAKQYDLAHKYVGDAQSAFVKMKAMYDLTTTLYKKQPDGGKLLTQWNEKHFVDESLQLIEVELAVNEADTAQKIQQQALGVIDDARLRNAIPKN